jgi:type III restriction enzyme
MTDDFFEHPILNSPYAHPARHWELDEDDQPTNRIEESRRDSKLMTPVPKPQKRRRRAAGQLEIVLGSGDGLSARGTGIQPDAGHQRDPALRRRLAQPAKSESTGRLNALDDTG